MGEAGYGNHSTIDREVTGEHGLPETAAKPAGAAHERQGADPTGSGDASALEGATRNGRPSSEEASDRYRQEGSGRAAPGAPESADPTPGSGALPDRAEGDEVDPGAG